MNLIKHLRIATPLIWIRTDEPDRVTDVIVENVRRSIFRLDPFDGFVVFQNNSWKKVLIEKTEDGETIEQPTNSLEEAIMYVIKHKGSLILNHAHKVAEDLIALFSGIYNKYRIGFYNNDLDEMPAQFIFLSCEANIPNEFGTQAAFIDFALPNINDLATIVAKIGLELPEEIEVELQKTVQAGLGLNESQFIQACNLSLAEEGKISAEFVNKWKLNMIKQGGILEIRRPKISLDDIGGLDVAKKIITDAVWIWNNPEEAREFQLEPIRKILLVGIPGTGKSAICEATAKTLDIDLAKTGISHAMNKFIGESENNIRAIFRQIHAMAPLVVWFDEYGREVSEGNFDGGTTSRVHGEFLTGVQELPDNVFLLAAANSIDHVAPEMLRADRFDRIMFVGLPTLEERDEIVKIHLGERADVVDSRAIAEVTATFTGAEIKQLIKDTRARVSGSERRHIETEDVIKQAPMMKNRLWLKKPQMIKDMYSRAKEEWDFASSAQLAEADMIIGGGIEQTARKKIAGNKQYTTFG